MSFSITQLRADVDSYLRTTVFPGQTVYKQSIEDTEILERDPTGEVVPYVSYATGHVQQYGARSMIGARGHDYVFPIYLKIVVPGSSDGVDIGEALSDRCTNLFIGADFDWSGEVRTRVSGVQFPIRKSDGGTDAVVFPLSFAITTQLTETA